MLLLQARHIKIWPPDGKKSSIFTHKFNLDAREDSTGAIAISTTKIWNYLFELLMKKVKVSL
jgi:hypothetical protein